MGEQGRYDFSEQCPGRMKRYYERHINDLLKEHGITSAFVPYIMVLSMNEGISLKTLTAKVGMDRAHTTRVISKLMDGGFVEDTASECKEYSIRLTPKGEDACRFIREKTAAVTEELLSCLDDDERRSWNDLWSKVNEAMDR
jgi:DNA-binding MarR family transcriptional regulator